MLRPYPAIMHLPCHHAPTLPSMERHADGKLQDALAEAGIGMTPNKVEDRGDRRVRSNPEIVAQTGRGSGAGLTRGRPAATPRNGRESHASAEEKAAGRLRIVVASERCVPRRKRLAALTLRPAVRLATQEQVGTHRAAHLQVS